APGAVPRPRTRDPCRLERLYEAAPILALRKRSCHRGIREDRARGMKGADEVLALRMIDARLAADRGVRHSGDRRRNRIPVDSAQEDRGGEARDVRDDSASHRDECVIPPHPARTPPATIARTVYRVFPRSVASS